MPKVKSKPKPIAPVTPIQTPPEPPAATAPVITNGIPLVYGELKFTEFSTAQKRGPLTIAMMKDVLLGWETEAEFKKRKCMEYNVARDTLQNGGKVSPQWERYITTNPNGTKPEHWIFGEEFHCKNLAGEKVRCNNNLGNRPFDASWCQDLTHTILKGQWAGPFTITGETVNCEIIRISRYGHVISGQHQMTACILAGEYLLRDREAGLDHPDNPKYPAWRQHGQPFLETVVATGMSEDPRVLMTVDYVKPRTVADVLYTHQVFKDAPFQDRRELCRVLATACDFLWTRTDARGYRTHPEVVAFLDRHPRLLECVLHLFEVNRATKLGGRRISNLHLSPGQCAALCYIMASSGSKTDGDEYRNMDPAPAEKDNKGRDILDWSYIDKATDFWTLLAGPDGAGKLYFAPVRTALGQLVTSKVDSDDNIGLGGRMPEKLAILAKAWERWKDHPVSAGPAFTKADRALNGCLSLSYVDYDADGKKLPNGQIELVDLADFFGIDSPKAPGKISTTVGTGRSSREVDPPVQYTDKEMDKMREEARARRAK